MCILLWATCDPKYSLILADNRDEFLERKTAPAQWYSPDGEPCFSDHPGAMLYGLDIDAGGTWFGTTRDGLVAMLTNVNDASTLKTATGGTPRSRGELVRHWLLNSQANADVQAYLDAVHARADAYSGFNLLVGVTTDGNATLGYVSNRPDPINDTMLEAGHAVYGLSNSTLSTPWPKVAKGEQLLCAALDTDMDESSLIEALFGMLRYVPTGTNPSWTAGPVRGASEMQNTIRVEPFLFPSSVDRTRRLSEEDSAAYTARNEPRPMGWYGTRTSTVLLITRETPPRAIYVERDVYQLGLGHEPPKLIERHDERHERRYEWVLA